MKRFIMLLALVATTAFAEPSFNQVQDLIGRQQYAAAEAGLVEIIKNHPNSAKAYYSMAQAQAGLGNLDKARYALDKATGLDPTLGFASQSQVQSLRDALTPQVKKIEMVEESHWFRNLVILIVLGSITWVAIAHFRRKRDEDEGDGYAYSPITPSPTPSPAKEEPVVVAKNEVPPRGKETTKKYTPKVETPKPAAKAEPVYAPTYHVPTPQPTHTTTVVNQSNDGFLTGMLVGNMLSSHHDHDRIIEREVVRETPSRSYESSSSRSSSWDSDSSSSSWDSDSSSSSRSSSWDSDSSSSSSSWGSSDSSSSSWDSGSSSSDSSW